MRRNSFHIVRPVVLTVAIFSLQSCFVARTYERPGVVNQEGFRTDRIPEDSLTMAEVSWQELFTDPFLASHINKGLENNLDIRIALQQILAAEAYFRQGKAGFLPSLNARTQVNHQELSNNSQFGSFFDRGITQFDLTGTLSWEADIWGKIRSNRRATEATYLQSVAAHQTVKTQLIASIASVYYQLLALDQQREITRATIANRDSGLATTIALRDAGSLTEVAVQQTDAQLQAARALLVDLDRDIRLLENTMSILLGEEPHAIQRGILADQEVDAELKTGFPIQLLRNRPDVIAAEYGLINAFELSNVARSNFYPSLNISASGGLQSLQLDQLFSVNSIFASVLGSLTQPIFNQRAIRTQYDVALSQQEQAYLNFRRSLLNASKEVSDALYAYDASEEKIELKSLEYEAYNKASQYSMELMNSGIASYLEVLTAQQAELLAELDLVNARVARLGSVVELYRALGGGWQ